MTHVNIVAVMVGVVAWQLLKMALGKRRWIQRVVCGVLAWVCVALFVLVTLTGR